MFCAVSTYKNKSARICWYVSISVWLVHKCLCSLCLIGTSGLSYVWEIGVQVLYLNSSRKGTS